MVVVLLNIINTFVGSGVHVINFADSFTCRTNGGDGPGIFENNTDITANNQTCGVDNDSFTHNSFAIMNLVGLYHLYITTAQV